MNTFSKDMLKKPLLTASIASSFFLFLIAACTNPKEYPTPLQDQCVLSKYYGDFRYNYAISYDEQERPAAVSKFYDSTLLYKTYFTYDDDRVDELTFAFNSPTDIDTSHSIYLMDTQSGYAYAYLSPTLSPGQFDTTYYMHDSNGYVVEERGRTFRNKYLIKDGNRIRKYSFDVSSGAPVDTVIYTYEEKLNRGSEIYGIQSRIVGKANKNLIKSELSKMLDYKEYIYQSFQGRYPLQVVINEGTVEPIESSTLILQYNCK